MVKCDDELIKQLQESYERKKDKIKKRLQYFKNILNQPDERIFAELCFCLCTPQSKATVCDKAITALEKSRLLYQGCVEEIMPFLNVVRFGDVKAKRIVEAKKLFTKDGKLRIRERIARFKDVKMLRDWLTKNVNGFGMKEASHFLRNVGLGDDLAILDRHVLKSLKRYGVVDEIPTLTRKRYLKIEQKMKDFADRINIPLDELDLLFWSEETGKILK